MRPLLTTCLSLLAASTAAAQPSLRVVTWNVWGIPEVVAPHLDARIAAVAPALAELEPDVVALQEVWESEHAELLVEAFREHGLVHSLHVGGDGREAGLLVASRHPIRERAFHPYSMGGVPLVPWHADFAVDKGVTLVEVDAPCGRVVVANTHLQANYGALPYQAVRLSQAVELARALSEVDDLPLVVAGDVNSEMRELPFRALRARAGLQDAAPGFGIDTILYRDGGGRRLRVVRHGRAMDEPRELDGGVVTRVSDHDALVVDLEVLVATEASASAPPPAWTRVRGEVRTFANETRALWNRASWAARVGGILVLLVLAFALRWRLRRTRWGLRRWPALAAVATGAVLLYVGFVYGPSEESGMELLERWVSEEDALAVRESDVGGDDARLSLR